MRSDKVPTTSHFTQDFVFGTATSAFQIEGSTQADGRTPSIWDKFCERAGAIADGSDAKVATNSYNLVETDIELLSQLGSGSYRFSLSWPRILPNAGTSTNQKGIDYYNRLIDGLLEKNILPFVTLFHWDLPIELEQKGGWDNRNITDRFAEYAKVCIENFGDRVEYWTTLNEPQIFWHLGYNTGEMAPGRTSLAPSMNQIHHILLAHGKAVRAMREVKPKGKYGIVQFVTPVVKDENCPEKTFESARGWMQELFLEPIFNKKYPEATKTLSLVQRFNPSESDMEIISEKLDFIGVNHYFRTFVKHKPWSLAQYEIRTANYKGIKTTAMGWEIYPQAMYDALKWVHDKYGPIPIYVTENGIACDDQMIDGIIDDEDRIEYLTSYLHQVARAIEDGIPVKGYFLWSLLDNFEWAHGMEKKFGLVHVDRKTQKRTPKESFYWYKKLIAEKLLRSQKADPESFVNLPQLAKSQTSHLENAYE